MIGARCRLIPKGRISPAHPDCSVLRCECACHGEAQAIGRDGERAKKKEVPEDNLTGFLSTRRTR